MIEPTTYAGETLKIPSAVANMPQETYFATPAISASGLKDVARSPAHYRYGRRKESRAMDIGTAIHTAILEPERFEFEFIELSVDDRRKKEAKDAEAEYGRERILTATEAANIRGMQQAVRAHSRARMQLDVEGWRELSVFAQDPETGANVRCRPDLLTGNGILLDLKKVRDARDLPMQRAVADYGYDLAAAFYCDVLAWATGHQVSAYALLTVEEEPPHGVRLLVLDDAWIERGRRLYRQALDAYAQCIEAGEWPGYADMISVLPAPRWVEQSIEKEAA